MYNDDVINKVNAEIESISKEAWDYAEKMLNDKRIYLDVLAGTLIEKPMLSSSEIDELFSGIDKANVPLEFLSRHRPNRRPGSATHSRLRKVKKLRKSIRLHFFRIHHKRDSIRRQPPD